MILWAVWGLACTVPFLGVYGLEWGVITNGGHMNIFNTPKLLQWEYNSSNQLIGDKDFNSCKKFPSGKRIVKLNLKPDTELGDLIGWISSITCKQFVMPGSIAGGGKKITIVAPGLMTRDEAYRAFLNALESIGLTVVRTGKFLTIIETAKAKSASIPVYDFDGRNLDR